MAKPKLRYVFTKLLSLFVYVPLLVYLTFRTGSNFDGEDRARLANLMVGNETETKAPAIRCRFEGSSRGLRLGREESRRTVIKRRRRKAAGCDWNHSRPQTRSPARTTKKKHRAVLSDLSTDGSCISTWPGRSSGRPRRGSESWRLRGRVIAAFGRDGSISSKFSRSRANLSVGLSSIDSYHRSAPIPNSGPSTGPFKQQTTSAAPET